MVRNDNFVCKSVMVTAQVRKPPSCDFVISALLDPEHNLSQTGNLNFSCQKVHDRNQATNQHTGVVAPTRHSAHIWCQGSWFETAQPHVNCNSIFLRDSLASAIPSFAGSVSVSKSRSSKDFGKNLSSNSLIERYTCSFSSFFFSAIRPLTPPRAPP